MFYVKNFQKNVQELWTFKIHGLPLRAFCKKELKFSTHNHILHNEYAELQDGIRQR